MGNKSSRFLKTFTRPKNDPRLFPVLQRTTSFQRIIRIFLLQAQKELARCLTQLFRFSFFSFIPTIWWSVHSVQNWFPFSSDKQCQLLFSVVFLIVPTPLLVGGGYILNWIFFFRKFWPTDIIIVELWVVSLESVEYGIKKVFIFAFYRELSRFVNSRRYSVFSNFTKFWTNLR